MTTHSCATARRRGLATTLVIVTLLGASPALASQASPTPEPGDTRVYAYSFKHQLATEAVPLVIPLLSAEGRIEVRPGGNVLVVRDTPAALARILPVIRSFDHPARPLEVTVSLVRGRLVDEIAAPPRPAHETISDKLIAQLRARLPYSDFEVLASSDVVGHEGEEVTFDLEAGYRVRFRIGTVVSAQRVRLHGFEVARLAGEPVVETNLVRSNLNLWLDRTMVLAMAASADSPRALMVIVSCRQPSTPAVLAEE